MGFTALSFLCCFLPLTLLLSAMLRGRRGYRLLLCAVSLVFYAWVGLWQALVFLGFVLVNHLISFLKPPARKALALAFNLGLLALAKLMPLSPVLAGYQPLVLLGFGYTALQALGYHLENEKGSLLDLTFYLVFLPKALTGPLAGYQELVSQRPSREHLVDDLVQGLSRLILGLSKKLLLADRLALVTLAAGQAGDIDRGVVLSLMAALVFPLQLYLDFSGFADIALGFAKCLGFSLPENFDRPFLADSLRAFWRRWHMSLSRWFAEVVYQPLGGSRQGQARAIINTFVVFMLIALWHGLGWGFALWGLWNALLVSLERRKILQPKAWSKWLRGAYVYVATAVGFVFFTAGSDVPRMLGGFFRLGNLRLALTQLTPVFLLACCASVLVIVLSGRGIKRSLPVWPASIAKLALLALCLLAAAGSHHLPFLYAAF